MKKISNSILVRASVICFHILWHWIGAFEAKIGFAFRLLSGDREDQSRIVFRTWMAKMLPVPALVPPFLAHQLREHFLRTLTSFHEQLSS